ncbi:MAG TPA: UrcA family protein [Allosphingosinicella sp.]|nr:UrcA family protein [Allosphingosinicella sp.]
MSKILIVAAATLTAVALPLPAAAQAASQPEGVRVSYADLDLSRAEGRATLSGRISRAAAQVCGRSSSWNPVHTLLVSQCLVNARRDAQAQVETAIARAQERASATRLAAR